MIFPNVSDIIFSFPHPTHESLNGTLALQRPGRTNPIWSPQRPSQGEGEKAIPWISKPQIPNHRTDIPTTENTATAQGWFQLLIPTACPAGSTCASGFKVVFSVMIKKFSRLDESNTIEICCNYSNTGTQTSSKFSFTASEL